MYTVLEAGGRRGLKGKTCPPWAGRVCVCVCGVCDVCVYVCDVCVCDVCE